MCYGIYWLNHHKMFFRKEHNTPFPSVSERNPHQDICPWSALFLMCERSLTEIILPVTWWSDFYNRLTPRIVCLHDGWSMLSCALNCFCFHLPYRRSSCLCVWTNWQKSSPATFSTCLMRRWCLRQPCCGQINVSLANRALKRSVSPRPGTSLFLLFYQSLCYCNPKHILLLGLKVQCKRAFNSAAVRL